MKPICCGVCRLMAAVVVVLVWAGGCSDGEESGSDLVEIEPWPHTVILSATDMALVEGVSAEGTVLMFRGSSPVLDSLAVDRVLVGGIGPHTPDGFLRRVVGIERDGDRVTVTTVNATLFQAFKSMDVQIERSLDPDEDGSGKVTGALETVLGPVSASISDERSFQQNLNWVAFDGDGDSSTKEDRIEVSGELSTAIGFSFRIKFNLTSLEDQIKDILTFDFLGLLDDIGLELKFVVHLAGGAELNVDGRSSLSFRKQIDLIPPLKLPAITAGPLVLVPRLHAIAAIEGSATGVVLAHMAQSATLDIGVEVKGPKVTPIGGIPQFSPGEASADINAVVGLKAWVLPRIELLIYDIIGPYAGIKPYVALGADVDAEPCWSLHGGMDAVFGVYIQVLGLSLLDKHWDKGLIDKQFASGGCKRPPGAGGESIDPLFSPWARAFEGTISQVATLDEVGAIVPAHDGRYLWTADRSQTLFKFDGDGNGVWARSYWRTKGSFTLPVHIARAVPLLDASVLVLGQGGVVMKTDPAGHLEWAGVLDFADTDLAKVGAALPMPDGGALVSGSFPSPEDGNDDGYVARFDADGGLMWVRRIAGPRDELAMALTLLQDGKIVVAGGAWKTGEDVAWVLKGAPDGSGIDWFLRLVDCDPDTAVGEKDLVVRSALTTMDGDIVLGGRSFYPSYRTVLAKVKADGQVPWSSAYTTVSGLGLDLRDVAQMATGSFLMAGIHVSMGSKDSPFLAEVDSIGRVMWGKRYANEAESAQIAMHYTDDDRGVLLGAATLGFFDHPGGAWLMKVPRKDGLIDLPEASGASISDLSPVKRDSCISTEDYPGTWEVLPAKLLPLDLEERDSPVNVLHLAP